MSFLPVNCTGKPMEGVFFCLNFCKLFEYKSFSFQFKSPERRLHHGVKDLNIKLAFRRRFLLRDEHIFLICES